MELFSAAAFAKGGPRVRQNLGSRFYLCPLVRRETEIHGLGQATRQMIRMRMDVWWSSSMLARVKLIDDGWYDVCPFCTDMAEDPGTGGVPETALHAVLQCPAWATLRTQFLGTHIEALRIRVMSLQMVALERNRVEFLDLDETEMIFRALLGGRPIGDDAEVFLLQREDDLWDCPIPEREEHVNAMLGYLHALSSLRGPIIQTLISTESQSRTGMARRRVHPWALDVT